MINNYNCYIKKYLHIIFQSYSTSIYHTPISKLNVMMLYEELNKLNNVVAYLQKVNDDDSEQITLKAVITTDVYAKTEYDIINLSKKYEIHIKHKDFIDRCELEDIKTKNIQNNYTPRYSNVIGYDFDGVLHTSVYAGTIHPIEVYDYNKLEPNIAIFNNLKNESIKHDIVIVTARSVNNLDIVFSFIKKWNLPVHDVFSSYFEPKSKILKYIKASEYYDDNVNIKNEVESEGIKFNLVKNK